MSAGVTGSGSIGLPVAADVELAVGKKPQLLNAELVEPVELARYENVSQILIDGIQSLAASPEQSRGSH